MRLLHRKVTAAKALAGAMRFGLLLTLLAQFPAPSQASHSTTTAAPATPYDRAEHAHQALEALPEDQRTKRDYDHVLELFRTVYHDDPASPKADASIFAVAKLLAEQGRTFEDEKSLHDAIGQYEFLRREYPGSRYRPEALLAEGSIYLNDLNDPSNAKATFQSFLKQYPHNPLAEQARSGLKEIHTQEVAAKHPETTKHLDPDRQPPSETTSQARAASTSAPAPKHTNTVLTAALQSQSTGNAAPPAAQQTPPQEHSSTTPARPAAQAQAQTIPPQPAHPQVPTTIVEDGDDSDSPPVHPQTASKPSPRPASLTNPPGRVKTKLVSVTGVRHWSTSVYTRVAIDLGDEVQYEAARVPNPDRIFFDLHGAKLSPDLIGKSVAVTDDGFLKRIRVAQFSNDVTRVVLDVSDVSDYSAFLLPNPYRLIIDIHGRKPGSPTTQQIAQAQPQATSPAKQPAIAPPTTTNPPSANQASSNTVRSADAPPSNKSQSPPPARTPPQVVANPAVNGAAPDPSATQDIASLGHQPDKIKATNHPTTAPIAASVAGASPAPQPDLTPPATPSSSRNTKHSKPSASAQTETASIHEADPTADGGRSMVRALGLKIGRIVVDAGHGGHDSGTLGPDGIEEKDVVLDVSLRLGKLLKQRLGADVIFTRSDDTFIPLETRTAIANKAQADLFISVHANSSPDPTARGVETYYLNFTSSPESLELAARENAVSQQSIHQLSDLVKKIALHDKIDESREFASDVQKNLYDGLDQGNPGLKDRGVKQAPFVVLIGANMPSILAEISFLTNPDDARQLRDPNYRQRIAESIYRGVARYVSGLSGVRLAENSGHYPSN